MKRQCILKDNKGASLVMVLVAMFFVGIIAAIALTITVGNTKSTKASIDTSENFYSSESVLDDLKMFLKKVATSSATEAYGKTLEEMSADPTNIETKFAENFKDKFIETFNADLVSTGYSTEDPTDPTLSKMILEADFIKNQISFNRPGTITIRYDKSSFSDTSEVYPVLKGVEIIYVDENGYETKLTTDITFKAQLPSIETTDTSGEFTYDIDHFVMISGKSINPSNNTISGDLVGNVYAKNNFNVKTKTLLTAADTNDSDWINLRSQYVLVGGNINVKGRMTVNPIADSSIIYEGAGTKIGAEVWTNNLLLNATDSEVSTGRKVDPDDSSSYLNTDVYLKGSLELNGEKTKYTAVGGKLIAYSEDDSTYLLAAIDNSTTPATKIANPPKSSAIILNGLGAQLDLSGLDSLRVAGKAYTALPDLDGIDKMYDYYNGTGAEPAAVSYYTQGESITFRAIQSLYLIPGDYISGVGHNPMKQSEFASITSASINPPKTIFGEEGTSSYILNSNKFKSHIVRYLNGENYVYLFWDFKSTDAAVEYFNKVTYHDSDPGSADGRYYDLVLKQISMLDRGNGYIKLPSDTKTNGNAIKYDSTNKFGKVTASSASVSGYDGYFNGMMAKLDSSSSVADTNLLNNMFENFYAQEGGLFTHPAATYFDGEIQGPLSYQEKNGRQHTSNSVEGPTKAKTTKYWLKSGQSVTVNSINPLYTYVIITPGDVTFTAGCSGDFRGIIIAGGNITLPANMNMECLGMLKYNEVVGGTSKAVDTTEFQALLGVVYDDETVTNGNSVLRSIFGIRDNSSHAGGDNDGEFVKILTSEWKRN